MIAERIKEIKIYYFGETHGSSTQFANKMGVKLNVVTNWYSRGDGIGAEVVQKILKSFPEVDANWLLTGEGCMLKSEVQHTSSLSPPQKKEDPLSGGPEIEAKDDIIRRQESQIEFLKEVISIKEREIVDKNFAISELTKKIKILEGDLANRNLVQKKEKTA